MLYIVQLNFELSYQIDYVITHIVISTGLLKISMSFAYTYIDRKELDVVLGPTIVKIIVDKK